MQAEPERAGSGGQPPWAEGSVPLRNQGEEAEQALRLEILRARRRRARRARIAATGGFGAMVVGGVVLIAANLGGRSESVSGTVVIAQRLDPGKGAGPVQARIGPAVALVAGGAGKRASPVAAASAPRPEAPPVSAPAPEPVYAAPEPEPPAGQAPPGEVATAAPADASQEFGFEH